MSKLDHLLSDPDFSATLEACDAIMGPKNADYTQGGREGAEKLRNFFVGGRQLGITPAAVLGVYLHKHLSAIYSYIQRGQVESEPIEGRIHDAINYLLLLAKMIRIAGGEKGGGLGE